MPGPIGSTFEDLVTIVARLRSPDGCPWDLEQTQKSLVPFALEEAYELAEAIAENDQTHICEELGDFLFQVVLQAQVAHDEKHFTLADVIRNVSKKMVERHPHVFAEKSGQKTSAEVLKQWDLQKQKKNSSTKKIFNYPANLPPLITASKIGTKSYAWGFDWPDVPGVIEKIKEEWSEVLGSLPGPVDATASEIGDLLFTIVQLARHLKIDAEGALREANLRIQNRMTSMIELSKLSQEEFINLPSAEKENLWQRAKSLEGKRS